MPCTVRMNTSLHVWLLALVMTYPPRTAYQSMQQRTWLRRCWFTNHSQWRHVFVQGVLSGRKPLAHDVLVNDTLTLGGLVESYSSLATKTMLALRWAHAHASFEFLLKTDDDTVVHVTHLWAWVDAQDRQERLRLYAGQWVHERAQVLVQGMSGTVRPQHQITHVAMATLHLKATYPPYANGLGYVLGRSAVAAIAAEMSDAVLAIGTKQSMPEDALIGVLAHRAGLCPRRFESGVTCRQPPRAPRNGLFHGHVISLPAMSSQVHRGANQQGGASRDPAERVFADLLRTTCRGRSPAACVSRGEQSVWNARKGRKAQKRSLCAWNRC
mmetsp:Transcript_41216/g.133658  ORF Transcript_41216/g.133658 Transcript_41216/m.133658 type:complete len:327 (+) Transcript_41216:80-1060(+)